MNDALDVVEGDVWIEDGRIAAVGDVGDVRAERVIDAGGGYVLPGFIQTHVHLCQTLFRGYADDLALLDWLKQRIWPMEAAHTPASLAAAARLAAAELLLGGTTTVLTMETVHDTDAVFEALEPMGLRAVVGKCMMDADSAVPARLLEQTTSIDRREPGAGGALARAREWAAAAPRSRRGSRCRARASCSSRWARCRARRGCSCTRTRRRIATRLRSSASRTGHRERRLSRHASASPRRACASPTACGWTTAEQRLLAEREVKVLHCPGSNLKLASGIAPVVEMRARGISVSLGADGAACNNQLDMFAEMRLAAGLQAIVKGPGALTARDVLSMATREGARALGLDAEIGSIELGKQADLIVIERDRPHLATAPIRSRRSSTPPAPPTSARRSSTAT